MVECTICGSPAARETGYNNQIFRHASAFSALRIRICQGCGFGEATPELENSILSDFYCYIYRRDDGPCPIDFARMGKYEGHSPRATSQLMLARQYADFRLDDCFLDLGPGRGGSFWHARRFLPSPKLIAIELSRGASQAYARLYGCTTYSTLAEAASNGVRGKIVLLSHSLEHVPGSALRTYLRELQTVMMPDSVMLIEVPHADLRIHEDVRGNDAPHLLFFSRDALQRVLVECGYKVLFCETCGPRYRPPVRETGSRSALHHRAANLYRRLPLRLRIGVAALRARLKTLARRPTDALRAVDAVLANENFAYGGEQRDCLRVVVRMAPSADNASGQGNGT